MVNGGFALWLMVDGKWGRSAMVDGWSGATTINHTPEAPYAGGVIRRRRHTPEAPYAGGVIRRRRHTPEAPYAGGAIRRRRHTPEAPYAGGAIRRRRHTPEVAYAGGAIYHHLGVDLLMAARATTKKPPKRSVSLSTERILEILRPLLATHSPTGHEDE